MNARTLRYTTPPRRAALSRGFVWLFPMLIAAAGCGESRVPVFPVTGRVTVDGQPPVGAQIVLHPLDKSTPRDVTPSGSVKEDGSFAISAYEHGDGAPAGEYVATIQWFKIVPELGGPGPNVIPKQYTSHETSPIKVTVKDGPTTLDAITIKL